MVLIVLMEVAVPFTAEAQQQEIYVDRKELFKDKGKLKERLASCIYEWKWFDDAEIQKETVLVKLFAYTCPDEESGFGYVTPSDRVGLGQEASFKFQGLEYIWLFGLDGQSGYYDYTFTIRPDGTGLYYDFSNSKEGGSVRPSQIYSCVDRSDEAVNRSMKNYGYWARGWDANSHLSKPNGKCFTLTFPKPRYSIYCGENQAQRA